MVQSPKKLLIFCVFPTIYVLTRKNILKKKAGIILQGSLILLLSPLSQGGKRNQLREEYSEGKGKEKKRKRGLKEKRKKKNWIKNVACGTHLKLGKGNRIQLKNVKGGGVKN